MFRGRLGWAAAAVTVAVAHASLLPGSSRLFGTDAVLYSDGHSHAAVMQAIAEGHASRGWIDIFHGGFPLGYHYQPLAWCLGALVIWLGASTASAFHGLALASIAALSVVALVSCARFGMKPAAAALATIAVATVSPYNEFVSSWSTSLSAGMISQSLAMPFVAALAAAVFLPRQNDNRLRARALAPVLAMFSIAAHAQVATMGLTIIGVSVLAGGNKVARRRYFRAGLAASILGAAIYGPGIATLKVPFGYGRIQGWMQLGFSFDRLSYWLRTGSLFDMSRPSVMTVLTAVSAVWLAIRFRVPAARAALAALLVSLGLSVTADAWARCGTTCEPILAFLQPLRAVGLTPLTAGVAIAVALHDASTAFSSWERAATFRERAERFLPLVAWLATLGYLASVWPSTARMGRRYVGARTVQPKGQICGVAGLSYDSLKRLESHASVGRLAFMDDPPLYNCAEAAGGELVSPVPLAGSGGAGGHVGILTQATAALKWSEAGSAVRARTLGVGSIVHVRAHVPPPDGGWQVVASEGDVMLSQRTGSMLVDKGCIVERWSGSNAALATRIGADLGDKAGILEDPSRLIELSFATGPVVSEPLASDCDATSAEVTEGTCRDGLCEATVRTQTPVDVVMRVTAFPGWQLQVDGHDAPMHVVAPGFIATRVTQGEHRVTAEVSGFGRYLFLLFAGAALGLTAGTVRVRRRTTA